MDEHVRELFLLGIGSILGGAIAIVAGLAVWRLTERRWRRSISELVRTRPIDRGKKQARSSERSTMRIKVGVLPFTERPTLVHTGALPGVRAPRSPVVQTIVETDITDPDPPALPPDEVR